MRLHTFSQVSSLGVLAEGELGALSPTTHPAASLHQAMTVQHRMDGALGRDGV